ncbi:unnamed protein product [Mytilus coruscus]|uniref:C1q domain-containing protein n=1 Tax=Mytilus coruscus TaxID=42192 RepID=A0A6J8EFB3_MYTCO|nr:unnamed protein product [Mytilus coruscus]
MCKDASTFLFFLCCCSFAYGVSVTEQTTNANDFGYHRPINDRDIKNKDYKDLLLMLSDINRFTRLLEHQLNLTTTKVNNIEHILSKRISDFNHIVPNEVERFKSVDTSVKAELTSDWNIDNVSENIKQIKNGIDKLEGELTLTKDHVRSSPLMHDNSTENKLPEIFYKTEKETITSSSNGNMRSHSEQKHTGINRKVALTACTKGGEYRNGSLVDFTDVRQLYGIKNIDDFKKAGKFTCQSSGLYLLSVYINSFSPGSKYRLLKNNTELGRIQIAPDRDQGTSSWHTGSGVAVAMLKVNDTMSIQAWSSVYIAGLYSCITIIKL